MKTYEVQRIKKSFTTAGTVGLQRETEELLNLRAALDYMLVKMDFEMHTNSSYIYSFIVFEQ